jgi:glycosyltransferase involved in cell wall biosynthesis
MVGFNPSEIKVELPKKKYKILTLCDHPMSTSGVGVQAGLLFNSLLATGKYKFVSLGGALKHSDYRIMQPHPDFIIKPVDGFGTKEQIRQLLLTERPDALFLFTDPRQFIWVWEMADEIRQVCPIVYWHVWDNEPYPDFNDIWYKSTDLINCLAWKTYELIKPRFPDKTHYIPHAFPKEMYFPLPEETVKNICKEKFGDKADWFKVLWVNRNAHRKMGADVVACFSEFLDALEAKHGHRNAFLLMHTDPYDIEGPNLIEVASLYGLKDKVLFSTDKLASPDMNMVHNICDTLINVAKAEGFGLSTLIQMMVGKPIIALKTGGMTRQVVDYRDGTENGVAIEPASRQLVGSQLVPYIYEDYSNHSQVVDALMKIHDLTAEEKVTLKDKVMKYVEHEFKFENLGRDWDSTLEKTILKFKADDRKAWTVTRLENPTKVSNTPAQKTQEVYQQNNIQLDKEVAKLPVDITAQLMKNIKVTRVL